MMSEKNQIQLRAPRETDVAEIIRMQSDPGVFIGTDGRRFPISEHDCKSWLTGANAGEYPTRVLYVIEADAGDVVGIVQLSGVNWIARQCWFGLWIGSEFQNMGYGRISLQVAISNASNYFGLRQLRLLVAADNGRARSMYSDAGFIEEGVYVDYYSRNMTYCDAIAMRKDLRGE